MRAVRAALLALLLGILAPYGQASVAEWLAGAIFDTGLDFKTYYQSRHDTYNFDVRERAFYQKIVGGDGQSKAGTLKDARLLSTCRLIPGEASAQQDSRSVQKGVW